MKFKKYNEIIKTVAKSIQEWLNDTLAVLVLYKTPLGQATAFTSIVSALKKSNYSLDWFVYDNSPAYQEHEFHSNSKITYVHDPKNAGVSRAYNQGFALANKSGKKWLLLLDQDTVFTEDSLEKYYSALITWPQEQCFVPQLHDASGIISPFRFRLGNGLRVKSVKEGIHSFKELQFVNSGLMVSIRAFEQSNGYDEDFPLDFSDYAFIERLHKTVPSFVLVPTTLNHLHSSTSLISIEDELKRFRSYYPAAKLFMNKYHPKKNTILFRAWARAIKLCLKHKTLKFNPLQM